MPALATLSPEIHLIILQSLSHADRCTCLMLNKKWHDLTVPLVFRTVHFHVSNWHIKRYTQTIQFQRFLLCNPWLANVVKKLCVHYHWSDFGNPNNWHYHANDGSSSRGRNLKLTKPLTEPTSDFWKDTYYCLPNLECIQWLGSSPRYAMIPPDIKHLIPSLKGLQVPSNFPLSKKIPLDGLETLEFDEMSYFLRATGLWNMGNDHLERMPCPPDQQKIYWNISTLRSLISSACDFIQAMSSPLVELSALALIDLPFSCKNLTYLDLLFCRDCAIDSSIIKCLTKLEHFTLQDVDPSFGQRIKGWTSFLPNLTSLKLTGCHDREIIPSTYFKDIGEFIGAHLLLRRLDIDIGGEWNAISTLLPIFSRLGALEVLGLAAGPDMPIEGLTLLSQTIPTKTVCLSLAFSDSTLSLPRGMKVDDLFDCVSAFSCLHLLRLHFAYGCRDPVSQEQHARAIAKRLGKLEYFICSGRVWCVVRHPKLSLESWNKEMFDTPRIPTREFEDEDQAWLLRYKNI